MSKGILLFSLVAAALVTRVHLLMDRLHPPILMPITMKPGIEVFFRRFGVDNFRVDFLTADCRIALRIDFLADQNITKLNTFDGRNWGDAKPVRFQFSKRVEVEIKATERRFIIRMVDEKRDINYDHQLSLDSIALVMYSAGAQNRLRYFGIGMRGSQLEIPQGWFEMSDEFAPWIRVSGKYTNNFTIDLATNDSDTVALHMQINDSLISCRSRIDGQWGRDEANFPVALKRGKKIVVHIRAKFVYKILVNRKKLVQRFDRAFVFPDQNLYEFHPRLGSHRMDRVKVNGLKDVRIAFLTRRRGMAHSIPCKRNDGCEFRMPQMLEELPSF